MRAQPGYARLPGSLGRATCESASLPVLRGDRARSSGHERKGEGCDAEGGGAAVRPWVACGGGGARLEARS